MSLHLPPVALAQIEGRSGAVLTLSIHCRQPLRMKHTRGLRVSAAGASGEYSNRQPN